MARRRSRARKTHTTTSRRRRSPARRTRRVSRRRRRNPIDTTATLHAVAAGAVLGLGAYALRSQDVSPWTRAGIVAAAGLVLGTVAMGFSKAAGAGLVGAGISYGTGLAVAQYMADRAAEKPAPTSGMGRIPDYAYAKFGRTPEHARYRHLPMGAIQADLGAVRADLGAVRADLRGVQADLC